MSFLEIFERELTAHNITWCKVCDSYHGHKRGFATIKTRTVHYDSKIATRATLHDGLHEIGHIVANIPGMKRYEKEASAEAWAKKRMRELGISVPRKRNSDGRKYVARMKKWGKAIHAGRQRGAELRKVIAPYLKKFPIGAKFTVMKDGNLYRAGDVLIVSAHSHSAVYFKDDGCNSIVWYEFPHAVLNRKPDLFKELRGQP